MSLLNRFAQAVSLVAILVTSASAATNPRISVRPRARLVAKIDNTKVKVVPNSLPPSVAGLADRGRLAPSTPLHGMTLILKSTDEQEYALQKLLDQQQDKAHENFHQWATPASFGTFFGVESSDMAKVTGWLQDSGFTVDKVATGGRFIQFSGTSGQVEKAFHTEMHSYLSDGQTRISNATAISIPEALTPVVHGLLRLNNFRTKKSDSMIPQRAVREADGTMHLVATPLETTAGGSHYVSGSDIATIYNTTPLLAKGINGTGVSIGLVEDSDIRLSDVEIYRNLFGLPVNQPNLITLGPDPNTNSDDVEGYLDVEVAGAAAPMASITYAATGYNDFDLFDFDNSAAYLVDENATDIISVSFGVDETTLTTVGNGLGVAYYYGDNVFYQMLWEQAAAQGQSVFVSSGDSGPDTAAGNGATSGNVYSVNGVASTDYNVAVGGTEFNEGATYSTTGVTPYWGAAPAGPPYESALSYVPENEWNEGKFGTVNGVAVPGAAGTAAGGSGVSFYNQLPSWQVGTGVPTMDPVPATGYGSIPIASYMVPGPHRLLPDVSLMAASGHDGTMICFEGGCTLTSTGLLNGFYTVGGTSVAAPVMAGIQALINQSQGGRQGNPNYYYYKIAALQSPVTCNSATYVTTSNSSCGFHDVQVGNNYIPAARNGTSAIGWPAGVGFDMATGLGSPDAAHLAALWSTVQFLPTTVGLQVENLSGSNSPPIQINHGDDIYVGINVLPVDSNGNPTTGTPTGAVGLIAQETGQQGGVGYYTLGCASNTSPPAPGVANSLCFGTPGDGNPYDSLVGGALELEGNFPGIPGGNYNLIAHYTGDGTYGASNSQAVAVSVAPEVTTLEVDPYLMSTAGVLTGPPVTSFTYGQNIYLDTYVTGTTGYGAPSGNVTFTLNNGSYNLAPVTLNLDNYGDTYFDAGPGSSSFLIYPNYPVLPPGTYSVSAAYAGDASFNASTAPTFSISVARANPTFKATAVTPDVKNGSPANLFATVTNAAAAQFTGNYAALPATGTVTFVDSFPIAGTVLGTTTAVMINGVVSFTTPNLATGTHSIVATYNGDANYAPATAAAVTVTVTAAGTTTTTSVTAPVTAQVGTSDSLVATVLPNTATGSVYFYANGQEIGTATIRTGTATLSYKNFVAGAQYISATYGGSTTYNASSTTVSPVLTVTKNTPSVTLGAAPNGDAGSGYGIYATLVTSPLNEGTATAPNPAPSPLFNFYQGATLLNSQPVVATYQPSLDYYVANLVTTAVIPGPGTITATFVGDANYATATASEPVNIGLTNLALTVTSPSSSPNIGTGESVTFKALVTPQGYTTATTFGGTVSFYDNGTTLLGKSSIVPTLAATTTTGVATLTVTLPTSTSTHTITAIYSGDTHFYTSNNALATNITTSTPGFSIAVNPSSLTIARGTSGSISVTATVFGNWSGQAPLVCTGLPANSYCTFSYTPNTPPSAGVPLSYFTLPGANGGLYTGTLTITTLTPHQSGGTGLAGLLWLPALALAGFLGIRRKQLSVRGRQMLMLAILLCGTLATTACSSLSQGTPTGASTVTVTANGVGTTSASPSTQPNTTFSLTVQ